MAESALIFGIDAGGQVRHTRELRFTSRADLIRQLQPILDQHPLVEAWNGAVCLFRKGRLARLELGEEDLPGSR
jgi:hypothetical protein